MTYKMLVSFFYSQINEKMTKVSDDYHKMVKSVCCFS